jgi:hypothetical protein
MGGGKEDDHPAGGCGVMFEDAKAVRATGAVGDTLASSGATVSEMSQLDVVNWSPWHSSDPSARH